MQGWYLLKHVSFISDIFSGKIRIDLHIHEMAAFTLVLGKAIPFVCNYDNVMLKICALKTIG